MQNKFLYFPNDEWPSTAMLAAEHLALWQEAGSDYLGIIDLNNTSAPSGTIVLFHGNGGTALDRIGQ